MPLPILDIPALTVANALYLNAFAPDPATGSIFGPIFGESAAPTVGRITDGSAAADIEMSALTLMDEIGAYQRCLQGRGSGATPIRLPTQEGEDPWFLQHFPRKPGGNLQGRICLVRPPSRQLEIDLQDPSQIRLTVGFASQLAEISQTVTIDPIDHSIFTGHYYLRFQSVPFINAVRLALALASAVYSSDLYRQAEDLGAFQLRHAETGDWTDVNRRGRQFLLDSELPDDGEELSFASARSVFEAGDFREPLYRTDILGRIEDGRRDIEIVVYRPPDDLRKLMPLPFKLRRSLWNPALQRIQGKNQK